MLEIELNGEPHQLPGAASLHALVETLGLSGQAVALAVNRRVVPREHWRSTLLRPRDRVDVVRAIGGG
ncbi:sulfur carrier protein ThiS [Massilia norwichensis]|uniref:Sulfur carrier protein ThiS n=1 Tax=Massilia norwichensis TaxID=1442366 RepID=A0ABT2A1S6_9BURK|nr:sulfur carrier protein ThiS [Massilia norwichensis]MCS0588128.1 sulfur carrier protein ThiS [Massilia norwichensis]